MEEIYANVEPDKPVVHFKPSANRTDPRRRHRAVIVGLGLISVFLLLFLIVLGVQSAELSAIKNNLTELLQVSDEKLSSMTEERNQLNFNLTANMEELERLQTLYKTKKTCPPGWTKFGSTCYFISSESGSWDEGREDCKGRGADLVVIHSHEEQAFLSSSTTEQMWIGLTDKDKEGTWKWVDGTPLTLKYWVETQPDNGGGHSKLGEEDCAHIRTDTFWNDLSCKTKIKWVCEL